MTTPPPPDALGASNTPPVWPDPIYLLQTGDPVQGGPEGIANVATKQLDLRTQMLLAGQELQAEQIADLTTNLSELSEQVASSQAEVLAGIVGAQFSATGTYAEAFAAGWTLIDLGAGTAPLALTNAVVPVAGDDSLDVTSTAALTLGETYVLFDEDGYRQEVTVSQILDTTRIRVTPALTWAVTFPAWMSRTDWDVSTPRQATATAGGIYRTRPLDLGPSTPEGHAIIIRHSGPGTLDVEWSDGTSNGLIDAPWWRKRTASGATETQYLIPSSGPTRLRITAVGGPVTVHWLTTQARPALAEGTYNPRPRPRLISPAPDDQALGPQPVLQIAAYTPPPGLTVAGVVYEVVKVSDNSVIHTSPPQPLGSAYTLPDGVAQQGTAYRFTAKIKAADGSLGDPSKPVLGQTIPDFRVILAPSITAPASGATVQTGTALAISPFAVLRGTDTQTGVQMQVRRVGQEWGDAWDSGTLDLPAVLLLQAPYAKMGWGVQVRVRHWGADLGAGAWSDTLTVTVSPDLWITDITLSEFTIPEEGEYARIPVGGGAAGGASVNAGVAGGAGYRPNPVTTQRYTAGQTVPIRVGRGGQAVTTSDQTALGGNMGGQSSFFDDAIGEGADGGVPYGVTPAPTDAGISSGSSYGGGAMGNVPVLPGSDGDPGLGGRYYWSSLGLTPGAGGTHLDTRPGIQNGNKGGGGGVLPPWAIPQLAGTGSNVALEDHPASGTQAGDTILGGTGGAGYGAGGGGSPYGFNGTVTQSGGNGAPGCIILRRVAD